MSKTGSRGEQGDEQNCREGRDMNKECDLCHQSLILLQTVMKQKLFQQMAMNLTVAVSALTTRIRFNNLLNHKDFHSCIYQRQWLLYSTGRTRLGGYLVVHAG